MEGDRVSPPSSSSSPSLPPDDVMDDHGGDRATCGLVRGLKRQSAAATGALAIVSAPEERGDLQPPDHPPIHPTHPIPSQSIPPNPIPNPSHPHPIPRIPCLRLPQLSRDRGAPSRVQHPSPRRGSSKVRLCSVIPCPNGDPGGLQPTRVPQESKHRTGHPQLGPVTSDLPWDPAAFPIPPSRTQGLFQKTGQPFRQQNPWGGRSLLP